MGLGNLSEKNFTPETITRRKQDLNQILQVFILSPFEKKKKKSKMEKKKPTNQLSKWLKNFYFFLQSSIEYCG